MTLLKWSWVTHVPSHLKVSSLTRVTSVKSANPDQSVSQWVSDWLTSLLERQVTLKRLSDKIRGWLGMLLKKPRQTKEHRAFISHILLHQLSAALALRHSRPLPRKIWESSNCQMVQMADNLSSQVNLGRLSILECLSTCILRVTLVSGRVMVDRQWLHLVGG